MSAATIRAELLDHRRLAQRRERKSCNAKRRDGTQKIHATAEAGPLQQTNAHIELFVTNQRSPRTRAKQGT
jgi:hypothetical protein